MRLPLQPSSSGGALKPLAARNNVMPNPQAKQLKKEEYEVQVTDPGSFDEEDGENHPESANAASLEGNDAAAIIKPVKELSLIERRAAVFGNVHNVQKRAWKPKANTDTSIKANASKDKAIDTKDSSSDSQLEPEPEPINVVTSPTKTSPANKRIEVVAASPSHLDFESKKKAIFNFAKHATSCDTTEWIKDRKSQYAMDEDCDEVDARANETGDPSESVGQSKSSDREKAGPKLDGKSSEVEVPDFAIAKAEEMTYNDTKEHFSDDSKRAAYVESPRFKQNINAAQKFLSPAPGATTNAVFSPSPHLLKPSQMNLKTYSDHLSRNYAVDKEAVGQRDDMPTDLIEEHKTDDGDPINEADSGRADAFSLMNKLNQKCSALMDSANSKYATAAESTSNVESPKYPAATPEAKFTIECSPTPHLLKPSQMNFKSTYADNLFRKSAAPVTDESIAPNPSHANGKRPDFASRFSDALSPSDFPTKFADIVSPQTATSSVDFSPTLTRFLYLNQRVSIGDTEPEKKSLSKNTTTDITADMEPASQSEQVFSPLNAQMLEDMIGFTSSFSDAIASPRKNNISPTMMTRASKIESKPPETKISTSLPESASFSDFARFTPSNFRTGDEPVSCSSKNIMEKVKFFDSSSFASGSDTNFACPGQYDTDAIANVDAKNDFADFNKECSGTTEAADDSANGSDDEDLGAELDDILAVIPDAVEQPPSPGPRGNDEESAATTSRNVFFGSRFDEELGAIDLIKNSIGSPGTLNENLSTIDEADEDLAAQTKLFKESLTPELSEFYSQINTMFDRKVNLLEKRVKSATVENSVIKEEMCHQHQQIQSLIVQLESSRDMMQANQGLMNEIEELRAQLTQKSKKRMNIGKKLKFMGKKKKINWL